MLRRDTIIRSNCQNNVLPVQHPFPGAALAGPAKWERELTFTDSIKVCFQKYIDFNGRAPRSEYWWFALFCVVSQAIVNVIPLVSFVGWMYGLVLLLPSLAVTVRRLHDTGRSAWWLLIYVAIIIAIIVGLIVLIITLFAGFGLGFSGGTESESDLVGAGLVVSALLFAVGVVGGLMLVVLCAQPGTNGPNRYGPNPLESQPVMGTYGHADPGRPYPPQPLAEMETGAYTEAPPESSGPHQYCTHCGMNLQPEARFCTECGTAV